MLYGDKNCLQLVPHPDVVAPDIFLVSFNEYFLSLPVTTWHWRGFCRLLWRCSSTLWPVNHVADSSCKALTTPSFCRSPNSLDFTVLPTSPMMGGPFTVTKPIQTDSSSTTALWELWISVTHYWWHRPVEDVPRPMFSIRTAKSSLDGVFTNQPQKGCCSSICFTYCEELGPILCFITSAM